MDDFIPSETLKRTLRYWWVLALLMAAGGMTGVLLVKLQKPVYESQASITTAIDFAYAGRLEEENEDFLISTVGDLIGSDAVLTQVKENAASRDISISNEELESNFTRARQGYRWELTVRNTDPLRAQILTQLWVEAADRALAQMRAQTLNSLQSLSAQQSLADCFSQMVVVDPASSYCSLDNLDEVRASLESLSSQVTVNSLSDVILLSKISTEITDNAYLPSAPVVYKRSLTTLAGCFCGLMIGLAVLMFGKFDSK